MSVIAGRKGEIFKSKLLCTDAFLCTAYQEIVSDHKKSTRSLLSASTEVSVAYRTTAWYMVITTLLFGLPTLAFLSFYFLLLSKLGSLIFNTTDSHSVSAGLTLLFAYQSIPVFLYGQS